MSNQENMLETAKNRLIKALSDLDSKISDKILKVENDFQNQIDELNGKIEVESEERFKIEKKYQELEIDHEKLRSLGKEAIGEINISINAIEKILKIRNESS